MFWGDRRGEDRARVICFCVGARVPFKALTDYLEGGESLGEFLEQYPSVTREAAIAALEEARDSLMAHLG